MPGSTKKGQSCSARQSQNEKKKQPHETSQANSEDKPITQAVVVVDTNQSRFSPLSLEKPTCLIPLVNVPILEYGLECLSKAGIAEVYLVCSKFIDQWREYVKTCRWSNPNLGLLISLVVAPEMCSVGDALREIDTKGIIHSDFLLMTPDFVSNYDLTALIKEHKHRKGADKSTLMTILLKRLSPGHYLRERTESAIWTLQSETNRLLEYSPIESELETFDASVSLETCEQFSSLNVSFDFLDCRVEVCTPEVLSLFTENFDYLCVRKDFARGILKSKILSKSFYCHVIPDSASVGCYATRVSSLNLYSSVSGDLLSRWVYPIVPEIDWTCQDTLAILKGISQRSDLSYSYHRRNIYVGSNISIHRSAQIERNVLLGHGSIISNGVSISDSVIGFNVVIGPNVRISNCYIWNNVRIEANCQLDCCILADCSDLKEGTILGRRSIVSFDCVVGPAVCIPQATKITTYDRPLSSLGTVEYEDSQSIEEKIWNSQEILGSEANCYVFSDEGGESESLENASFLNERLEAICLGSTFRASFAEKFASAYEKYREREQAEPSDYSESESVSFTFHDYFSSSNEPPPAQPAQRNQGFEIFSHDIAETVRSAIANNYTAENTALEINSLKFACNTSFRDCRNAILPVLCLEAQNSKNAAAVFERWSGLIGKFVHSENDQLDLLQQLHLLLSADAARKSFIFVVPILYKAEILEGEVIVKWWHRGKAEDIFRDQMQPFIEWLEQSDDEE